MSAVNLKTLRAVRRVQVTGLAFAGADLPLVIVGGSLGLLPRSRQNFCRFR